jgi:glutamate dehydrogenase/leucine dehydrogenase
MEAFQDVLRLSRAMTYKAAVPGLNLGGGKSVIIGDPDTRSREPIFRAHGRHIERLGGRYITAEDVGTSPADQAHRKASEIYDTVLRVFAIAREEHIPSYKAADRLAERRLAEARKRKT